MTNATPGPVTGMPYAAIIITGGFAVERFNFPDPLDALVCCVRYLREGKQARLSDRTAAALLESPDLNIDALLAAALGARPVTDVHAPVFKAASGA